MATALANRAASDRSQSLLKLSFNFLRSFSTASANNPTTTASSSSSASKKPKRKKKKNLFEVAQFLPNWGLGYHMAKTHWTGVSYQITKINLYKVSLSLSVFSISVLFRFWEKIIVRNEMESLWFVVCNNAKLSSSKLNSCIRLKRLVL